MRFLAHGQMKPEQLKITRLKREVNKLMAGRDILKCQSAPNIAPTLECAPAVDRSQVGN